MPEDGDNKYGRGRSILTEREREVLRAGPGGELPDGKLVSRDYHHIVMKRAEGRLKKLSDDIEAMDDSRTNLGDLARREVYSPLEKPVLIPSNWKKDGDEYVHKETRRVMNEREWDVRKSERDVLDAYLNETVFVTATELK